MTQVIARAEGPGLFECGECGTTNRVDYGAGYRAALGELAMRLAHAELPEASGVVVISAATQIMLGIHERFDLTTAAAEAPTEPCCPGYGVGKCCVETLKQRRESPRRTSQENQNVMNEVNAKRLADLLVMIDGMQRHHAMVAEENRIHAGAEEHSAEARVYLARATRDQLIANKLADLLKEQPLLLETDNASVDVPGGVIASDPIGPWRPR